MLSQEHFKLIRTGTPPSLHCSQLLHCPPANQATQKLIMIFVTVCWLLKNLFHSCSLETSIYTVERNTNTKEIPAYDSWKYWDYIFTVCHIYSHTSSLTYRIIRLFYCLMKNIFKNISWIQLAVTQSRKIQHTLNNLNPRSYGALNCIRRYTHTKIKNKTDTFMGY